MKHILSFCEIEQLSNNIFEVTINEGAVIDENCALEAETFWQNFRNEPYGLLVNNKNKFSYSFFGAQKIGEHSLEQRTAVLVNNPNSKDQMKEVLDLKEMFGNVYNKKVFQDRREAISWLESF